MPRWTLFGAICWVVLWGGAAAEAQRIVIPRQQDRPPGPPLSPVEAVARMTVPEGFAVEIVAAEPDIVNPVAMTIDERGRFWITESFEYPRREPGPGRDRVKILEDADGDGRAEKVAVFAEGLNIPSGIAVGHGGVWVANSPDILFLQDTDGDGRADRQEVVVTGFGRTDTHELPNSFTWGPDGWLYGLNGVFNHSHVRYAKENPNFDAEHPGWQFTCAMFRIHPRTREFQVFAEGTSNPWGIAFDSHGSAFVSACVIDHLWHITETGYYHRQAGPYPPHTWKIESIVDHAHQKAAYCGLEYFDSDAYPAEYRGRLYMGNIHGGCINVDVLRRNGATYISSGVPDFLAANDVWFMPVVQKTGPDGSLYILDWYDRYHCYQDANADPEGIDRGHGRLYRVRYRNSPRAKPFDLARETDEQLIERLGNANVYFRATAQRILQERRKPETVLKLLDLAASSQTPEKLRRHAFWAAIGGYSGGPLPEEAARMLRPKFLRHPDATLRAWAIRFIGDSGDLQQIADVMPPALADSSPDVRLQAAIAAGKLDSNGAAGLQIVTWLSVLSRAGDDPLTPRIVWQNLHPVLEAHADEFVKQLREGKFLDKQPVLALLPRAVDRILDRRDFEPKPVVDLAALLIGNEATAAIAAESLSKLAARVQSGEIKGERLARLRDHLQPVLRAALDRPSKDALYLEAALLVASWRDPAGLQAAVDLLREESAAAASRLRALDALIASDDQAVMAAVDSVLQDIRPQTARFRGDVIASLGRSSDPAVATVLLKHYERTEPELQPRVIELLTQRVFWSRPLLAAIGAGKVPASALNLNQVRRLLASGDAELSEQVRAKWGTIRDQRDPDRERYLAEMKQFIRRNPGDPFAGEKVFKKVCAQCHKIYGEGTDVGPDITRNGRNSFEQLLFNVFDPSLVIGAAYQARTVVTLDGRVLSGLLVEESPQRVVLKVQGGKLETIARDDIEIFKTSEVSMMPEKLENQLQPVEIADLFAFLTLDRHPSDPEARQLPGVREVVPRETRDPQQFASILAEVAPGFQTKAVGEGGVALLAEHRGRAAVVRTHPVARDKPCVLFGTFTLPAGRKSQLYLAVSHHERGDWQLLVKADGRTTLLEATIGPQTTVDGWAEFTLDLSSFAGRTVHLELVNQPTDWSYEFAYWGRAAIWSD